MIDFMKTPKIKIKTMQCSDKGAQILYVLTRLQNLRDLKVYRVAILVKRMRIKDKIIKDSPSI